MLEQAEDGTNEGMVVDLRFEALADELNSQQAQRVVWNEANTDTATEMRAQGKSIESIADVLHMSPGNVSHTLTEFPGAAEPGEEVARERTEIASATFQNAQEDKDAPAHPLGRMGGLGEMGGLGNIKESPAETDEDDFLVGDEDRDEAAEGGEYDEDGLEEEESSNKPDFNKVYAFVESYTAKLGVIMLLNGKIERMGQKKATTLDELRERYKKGRISKEGLREILKAEAGKQGLKLGSYLNTAIALWRRKQAEGRRDAIFTAVNVLNPNPQPGWENLVRMAEVRFEGPPEYGAAVLEQIIWETQRRIFGEEEDYGVEDPHFYLFSSKQQWNGKSRLCRDLFSPVRELIRGSVRFSAMMDERWHGLWTSHALVIDEIGLNSNRDRATLAKLKGIITEYERNQRPMGGNEVDQVENRTVLVGTSQYKCADLFGDPDGMRRYMEVRLVSGFRYKDTTHPIAAKVRAATEAINWLEVWQGIDFRGEEPILRRGQRAYLDTLQAAMTPEPLCDSFDRWLNEVTQASLLTYRPKEQRSERIYFSGVLRHYMDHAQHYPVPPLNKEEFRLRIMAVTCNISTKGGRKPDQPESHHRFDRKDGETSTTYKYIGPNR